MSRLPDLEAWAVFAKVAEIGSFARTAQEFGLSKATVSKAISRLETRVGAALLHRTSRRLSLTAAGHQAVAQAARILADGEALEAAAMAEAVAPRGLVRLTAPMSFGMAHVAPLLPELLAAYPGLSIDLHLSDQVVDLVGGGFDVAVRIATLADSTLRARRVCWVRRLLVGAPAYFARHGGLLHPRDLVGHACVTYAYSSSPERWRFFDAAGAEATATPRGRLRVNNGDAVRPLLLAGQALAILPEFLVSDDLVAGRLVVAMPGWSMPAIALSIVTPPGATRPARVTTVIEFLARRLAGAAWALADAA